MNNDNINDHDNSYDSSVCVMIVIIVILMLPQRPLGPRRGGWAVTFIPAPMPKRVCRMCSDNKWVHKKVCINYFGQGRGYEYHSPVERAAP